MKILLLIMSLHLFAEVDITFEKNNKKNMPFYSSLTEDDLDLKVQEKNFMEKKYLSLREEIQNLKDTLNYFDKKFLEKKVDKNRMVKEYSFALRLINKRVKKIKNLNNNFKKSMGEDLSSATAMETPNYEYVKNKLSEFKKMQKYKVVKKEKNLKKAPLSIEEEQKISYEKSKTMTFQDIKLKSKIENFKIKSNVIFSTISLKKNNFKYKKQKSNKSYSKISDFFFNLNNKLTIKKVKKKEVVKVKKEEIKEPKIVIPTEVIKTKKRNEYVPDWDNGVIIANPERY